MAPITRAARRVGVPADRIDDVVQDVLLTIHRARHTYDPARPFNAWLNAIAVRRAIDVLRRTGRQSARELHAPIAFESHPDETADPTLSVERSQAVSRLGQALAGLPLRQREAVQMLVLDDQSVAEAAVATKRSEGSLKVNLHRALKAMRRSLSRED
jgi:RNA polymerase sigma-70 factor (ECF subfamily)